MPGSNAVGLETEILLRLLLRGLAVKIGTDELFGGPRLLRHAGVTPVGQREPVGDVGATSLRIDFFSSLVCPGRPSVTDRGVAPRCARTALRVTWNFS